MSNMNDLLAEMDKDEEIRCLEDGNYFAEQDKKFKELQIKLNRLKDENKKQMDIIINSLDTLILNKNIVEKTLEETDDNDDSLVPDAKNLTVVDLLSKVTGFINDMEDLNTSNKSLSDELQEKVLSEGATHDSKVNAEKKDPETDLPEKGKGSVTKVEQEKKDKVKTKVAKDKKDTVKTTPVKDSTDVQVNSDAI